MYAIASEAARKMYNAPILFHKRPNHVHLLVAEATEEPIGARMTFFPHDYAGSPTSYFTSDEGKTFRHCGYAASPESTEVLVGDEETNLETLAILGELLRNWREGFLRTR